MSGHTILLLVVPLVGAYFDWKYRRIPNWLTFGTFFFVLILNIIQLNLGGIKDGVLGFFVGILLLIIFYLLGGMGAGDVKLLGAVGAIVGYKEILLIFIYSGIGGLFLVLMWIIFTPGHLKFLITTGQILPAVDKKEKLPYGIAILLGTILYITFGKGHLFSFFVWQ